jgi:hypothetical protein
MESFVKKPLVRSGRASTSGNPTVGDGCAPALGRALDAVPKAGPAGCHSAFGYDPVGGTAAWRGFSCIIPFSS